MIIVGLPNSEVQAASGNIPGVPKHVMVGYWHNFFNGTTRTRLKDCPAEWNVINLSFGEPSDHKGLVEFKPYSDLYSSDAQFVEEVEICHSKGQKVVLSIGGQNGVCTLSTAADRDNFVRTCTDIIDRYHLDGLDIDFEGHSISLDAGDNNLKHPTSPSVVNLIDALNTICDHYGDKFILTMAPETLLCQNGCAFYGGSGDSRNGVYLPVIDALRDKLSWLQVQYYNVASLYTPDDGVITNPGTVEFNVHAMDMMLEGFYVGNFFAGLPGALPQDEDHYFEGLRPDQIVMGVPSVTGSAGAGVMPPEKYIEAMEFMRNGGTAGKYTVKNPSKDFRGIMTWSINWDEFDGNGTGVPHKFSSVIAPYIAKINAEDTSLTIDSIEVSPSSKVTCGTELVVTAGTAYAEGNVQYQFDVYKDDKLMSAGTASASNVFSFTPQTGGNYYVKVTAKDNKRTTVKDSAVITVVDKSAVSVSADKTGTIKSGTEVTFTASASGGDGQKQFIYYIVKDGKIFYNGLLSTAATCRFTPLQPGTYDVLIYTKDNTGIASAQTKLTVIA